MEYDVIEIRFADGTTTIIHALEDDNYQDVVVDLCETHGWDVDEVTAIQYIETRNTDEG